MIAPPALSADARRDPRASLATVRDYRMVELVGWGLLLPSMRIRYGNLADFYNTQAQCHFFYTRSNDHKVRSVITPQNQLIFK
jgi:hypothetical protein